MVPAWSLMALAHTWPKFTQTRSRWLRKLQVLEKLHLQQVPPPQGRRHRQISRLPARHPYPKAPIQQIGQSVRPDLSLDRPMAQRHQQTPTAPRQGLAKALFHLRERLVPPKFQREALGQSHLRQATNDLSHQSVTEMIHMLEVRDLHKRETLIQLTRDLSLVMCGVDLASIRQVVLLEFYRARTVAMILKLSIENRRFQCMA